MRTKLSEVQALRAVAVLSVVVYHLQPRWFPGGFVGVDVFFVISGFLITRHLLKEVAKTGRVSLSRFWANRVRRILPASLVVIVATMVTAWICYPLGGLGRISTQGLASTWYVQNWALAADAVDYSASDNAATPLQHFWSLSVEEQFYLVWPVLLLAVAFLATRTAKDEPGDPRRARRWLTTAMAAVVVASLGYSIAGVASGTPSAYFDTFGRLWELGLGGVIAGLYRDPQHHPRLRAVQSLAGFALVGFAGATFNEATPFPGLSALIPTIGAALVITAGRVDAKLSLTPILEWRPIQAIGDWSYSIYLWHFGVIVTATTVMQTNRFGGRVQVGLLAATIAISYLSYTFVEQPFRTQKWQNRRPGLVLCFAVGALAITTAACLVLPIKKAATEQDWRQRAEAIQATVARYQASPEAGGPPGAFPDGQIAITPSPLEPAAGWRVEDLLRPDPETNAPYTCQAGLMASASAKCVGGTPTSPIRVALVGDSHATMMVAPLNAIAQRKGWRLETYLHASCPFTVATRQIETLNHVHCKDANHQVMAALLSNPPDLVISVALAKADWLNVATDPEVGVKGYAQTWSQLRQAGSQVVAITDVPEPRPNFLDCMSTNYDNPERCSRGIGRALATHGEIAKAAALVPGVRVIDLKPVMCAPKSCKAVINHILVYRDQGHITRTWALALTSYFERQLPDLPPR